MSSSVSFKKTFLLCAIAFVIFSFGGCQDGKIVPISPVDTMTDNNFSTQEINAADRWIALKEGQKIGQYYRTQDGIFWDAMRDYKVEGVDINSFVVNKIYNNYAKDKEHAYYFGFPLEVDLASFLVLDQDFHKDKNKVYSGGHTLEGADPATFEIINFQETFWKFYSRDKNNVYFQWNKLPDADPTTFQTLGQSYSKDKNNVYLSEKKLEGADPATFKISGSNGYTQDKNSVYWGGARLKDADPAAFEVIEPKRFYSKDKQSVYFYAKKLEGADVASFELLEHTYSKDKNTVYYEDKKIEGSDPATFKIINQNQLLSRDKNGCYRYEKKDTCPSF